MVKEKVHMTDFRQITGQSKPKILVFAMSWFPPKIGGEANILKKLVEYYPNERLVFFAKNILGSKEFDSDFPCKIHRLKIYSGNWELVSRVFQTLKISWLIHKEKPDIILVGNGGISFILRNALKILGKNIPYVILVHGTELLSIESNNKQILPYLKSSLIIANSKYTKSLVRNLGIQSAQIKVVRPGCDPKVFRPGLDVDDLRKKLKMENKKIILTVGSLVKRKGHDMVIRALKQINISVPNVFYIIAGTGIYLEDLKKLATDLGVNSSVLFLGYVNDSELPYLYNLCDLFVMPSRIALGTVEGFGMVFTEAAACCKPCIAGNNGGMGEAVIHGKTGILVNPNDVNQISKCIIEILTNEKKTASYGIEGRKRVEDELSWTIYYKKIISLLLAQLN